MSIPRCLLIWLAFCALSRAALLQVNIVTEFNGEPMAFNSLRHKTASDKRKSRRETLTVCPEAVL